MSQKNKWIEFLRLWGLFNIFSFIIVICMAVVFFINDPAAFCYEVVYEEPVLFEFDDYSFYLDSNSTSCKSITPSEFHSMENKVSFIFWLSFVCLIGFCWSNPDFRTIIKAFFERFK